MQVIVTPFSVELSSHAHTLISGMVEDSLIRFSHRVSRVSVSIFDENGPRGGVDKLCRINVQIPGLGPVITEGRHASVVAAVAAAARRAQRIVKTNIKRRKTVRQPRRFDGQLPDERTTQPFQSDVS